MLTSPRAYVFALLTFLSTSYLPKNRDGQLFFHFNAASNPAV